MNKFMLFATLMAVTACSEDNDGGWHQPVARDENVNVRSERQ